MLIIWRGLRMEDNKLPEFQKEILKAKKIFELKNTDKRLNSRIGKVINAQLLRNNNYDVTLIQERCYHLFYTLGVVKNTYSHLTPCKLYKIFRLCLSGLDKLLFFQDTVTNPKEFSYKKYRDIIEKTKPFIVNHKEIKTQIPRNPNDEYNDIYFELINNYNLKKDDVINLLDSVYDKKKKAKVPKRTITELQYLKDTFHRIAKNGGKEKGLSEEEIKNEIKEIDANFKDYL